MVRRARGTSQRRATRRGIEVTPIAVVEARQAAVALADGSKSGSICW
jgi:hypothetical protein